MDPLASKYPSLSPFAYCANNPIKYIDPNGMWIDDYFDKEGNYLGSDNAKTDNVRIFNYDKNTFNLVINKSKEASVDPTKFLQSNSRTLDKTTKNDFPALKGIANYYYAQAGYNLNELPENSVTVSGAYNDVGNIQIGYGNKVHSTLDFSKSYWGNDDGPLLENGKLQVTIPIYSFGDQLLNKWDFINLYRHERGKHGSDLLDLYKKGKITDGYYSIYRNYLENRAYNFQMNDKSWNLTSPGFKSHILKNKEAYGK